MSIFSRSQILFYRLEANYEIRDGICLPRCLLYHHYLDYMRKRGTKPIGAAAFGKVSQRLLFAENLIIAIVPQIK